MPKIGYLSPYGIKIDQSTGRMIDFEEIYSSIKSFISTNFNNFEINRVDSNSFDIIDKSDVIICDVTTSNPNCLYELGYAHRTGKSCILTTAKSGEIPFDLQMCHTIAYNPDNINTGFLSTLSNTILLALSKPEKFKFNSILNSRSRKIFLSYSHKDNQFLERILVHLKPLEKSGQIDIWVDTKLKAGDLWRKEIEAAVQSASIAVLLISADFLASDFIVNNELPPILVKAEENGTIIIPVILKPCRFSRDPKLNMFHSLNPPDQALSQISESECEVFYDKLAQSLEYSVRAG